MTVLIIGPPKREPAACHFCGVVLQSWYQPRERKTPPACRGCRLQQHRWRRANDAAYRDRVNEARRLRRARLSRQPGWTWRPELPPSRRRAGGQRLAETGLRAARCAGGCGRYYPSTTLTNGLCYGPWCPATTPEMLALSGAVVADEHSGPIELSDHTVFRYDPERRLPPTGAGGYGGEWPIPSEAPPAQPAAGQPENKEDEP